tara:strand:+ start:466 stop:855 length:390 start_codon:yes stop_codon:yes gene_type:complete
MKNQVLNIYPIDLDHIPLKKGINNDDLFRLPWSYLHGKAEEKAINADGWDIYNMDFTSQEEFDIFKTKEGIYDCIIHYEEESLPGKLFYWDANYDPDACAFLKGLVVLLDDQDSIDYAQENYDSKAVAI